jgi:hypothetical protein
MKQLFLLLIFATLFCLPTAWAQNLTKLTATAVTAALSDSGKQTLPASLSDPATAFEAPLVKIDIIGLRPSFFQYKLPPQVAKTLTQRAKDILDEAYFQRLRFDETGQPIEMEHGRFYYRRDDYSYTKGVILYKFFHGAMDLGLYKRHFSPASTYLTGKLSPDFSSQDSHGLLFRNGERFFFSLRVNLPMR